MASATDTNQAYRLPFARVGQDVTIWPLAKIVGAEQITIGDSVIIDDFAFVMGGEATQLGSFVHLASFCSLVGGGRLVVGDFAGLSSGVRVYTGNDDYLGGGLTGPTVPDKYRHALRSFVEVGRHAIVGANSVILPSVTIGEGAAIGANSLVNRDCEPWTIYAGSPARPLKPRPAETIRTLESQLRAELYDAAGAYIPRRQRSAQE